MNWRESVWAVRCVWLRYFAVYRKNLLYAVTTTFAEPVLYVFSFGFGMGSLIGNVSVSGSALAYRPFVLSGLIGQTLLMLGFFDGAYGSFIRMYYQRIFKAMATTPITLAEVLWAELLWGASKATFGVVAILTIAGCIGDFALAKSLAILPIAFVVAITFTAFGITVAAVSDTIEQISYPQNFIVFPMFLFSGVYFPVDTLPEWLRFVGWCLPLTPALNMIRGILFELPICWYSPIIVSTWAVTLIYLAQTKMAQRLIK